MSKVHDESGHFSKDGIIRRTRAKEECEKRHQTLKENQRKKKLAGKKAEDQRNVRLWLKIY